MQSVLTVVTPADSSDLTILATVKAECGITTTAEDSNIEMWIDQASGACAAYCDRVFGLETVAETFRNRVLFPSREANRIESILLQRNPVVSIVSVVEDGTTLTQDIDYQLDAREGIVYRLNSSDDSLTRWFFNKLIITYSAGWELLGTLPQSIERACITQVKAIRSNATRDSSVKSENIPGVLSTTYATPNSKDLTSLDPDAAGLLDPYRNIGV